MDGSLIQFLMAVGTGAVCDMSGGGGWVGVGVGCGGSARHGILNFWGLALKYFLFAYFSKHNLECSSPQFSRNGEDEGGANLK